MSARKNCVFVQEVAVLSAKGKRISYWEPWDSFNTHVEAASALRISLKNRPSWVSEKFHKQTNRLRKYIPACESGAGKKPKCDCRNHENQVCDICQKVTGKERDKVAGKKGDTAMSLECSECEHDLRGGHLKSCSRYRKPCAHCLKIDCDEECCCDCHLAKCKCRSYDAEFNGMWFPMTDKTKCSVHGGAVVRKKGRGR